MGDLAARFRAVYGAPPRHLLLLVGCFAVVGWVALRLAGEPTVGRMLLWFVGAAVAHDLLLFPAYAGVDRALRAATRTRRPRPGTAPSALNHVRVPALAGALLFLVYLPGILRQGRATYLAATGQDQQPFLGRWMVAVAVLFAASGAVYLLRWWWARRR